MSEARTLAIYQVTASFIVALKTGKVKTNEDWNRHITRCEGLARALLYRIEAGETTEARSGVVPLAEIILALDRANGNQTRAAELLGIKRSTLAMRLIKLNGKKNKTKNKTKKKTEHPASKDRGGNNSEGNEAAGVSAIAPSSNGNG